MKKHFCPQCPFRARYDRNPGSLLGRLWRWHANWCPGWNGYMRSLAPEKRHDIARRYGMKKYQQP